MTHVVLLPAKLEKEIMRATIVSAVVNILLNIFFIPAFQHIGAAFGYYVDDPERFGIVEFDHAEYGYCLNTLHSYTFEGSAGFEKMQNIMVSFRKSITEFAGKKVLKCLDYSEGIDGLPKSDVLKFFLEDNCSIVVRPSGTEPKLKAYISVSATTKEEAQVVEGKLARAVEEKM